MSYITSHRLVCDETGCDQYGPYGNTPTQASDLARVAGWDTGPRQRKTWKGDAYTVYTDYCPDHAREGKG